MNPPFLFSYHVHVPKSLSLFLKSLKERGSVSFLEPEVNIKQVHLTAIRVEEKLKVRKPASRQSANKTQ